MLQSIDTQFPVRFADCQTAQPYIDDDFWKAHKRQKEETEDSLHKWLNALTKHVNQLTWLNVPFRQPSESRYAHIIESLSLGLETSTHAALTPCRRLDIGDPFMSSVNLAHVTIHPVILMNYFNADPPHLLSALQSDIAEEQLYPTRTSVIATVLKAVALHFDFHLST